MKLDRRNFLYLAAGAGALPATTRFARAQAYPTRPINLIVQVPAGSSPDIIARLIGQWLSERLGQPVVVESRPGASGNIATESVVRAPADGQTLLFAMSANAINETLFDNLRFSFRRDTVPVALVARIPLIMQVHPSVPAKTIPEFIAYAKANPGKVNLATSGHATALHVAAELFKMMAEVDLVAVAYRGEGPAIPDLLKGRVQVMFGVLPATAEYIKSGQLRVLGVTTAKRLAVLPDVPTIDEFLPGYEASGWYGIAAPAGTPREVVETLNKEVNAALADPKMKDRLDELGCLVSAGSPADFGNLIAGETEKWGKVIRAVGLKPQ